MNTKKLQVFLVLVMAVGLLGVTAAAAITEPDVTLGDNSPEAKSRYTIEFTTDKSLTTGLDEITVKFGAGTDVVTDDYTAGNVEINPDVGNTGSYYSVATGDYSVNVSEDKVDIVLGQNVSGGNKVGVKFASASGILENSSTSGYYTLEAKTTKETAYTKSKEYAIVGAPTLTTDDTTEVYLGASDKQVELEGSNLVDITTIDFTTGSTSPDRVTVKDWSNQSKDDMYDPGNPGIMAVTIDVAVGDASTPDVTATVTTNTTDTSPEVTVFTLASPPAPEIESVSGTTYQEANDTITIKFDNGVEPDDGTWDEDEFSAVTSDGTAVTLSTTDSNYQELSTYNNGLTKELRITLNESGNQAYLVNGDPGISLKPATDKIVDQAKQAVSATAVTGVVDGDTVDPEVTAFGYEPSSPVSKDTTLTVSAGFSEKMQNNAVVEFTTPDGGTTTADLTGLALGGTPTTADQTIKVGVGGLGMTGDGTVTITLKTAYDLAGNEPGSYPSETVTVDNTAPTVDSVSGTTKETSPDTVTVTFSEDVSATADWGGVVDTITNDETALTIGNITTTFTTADNTLTITLSETTDDAYLVNDSPVVVSTTAGSFKDNAGNLNEATTTSGDVTGDTSKFSVTAVQGDADANEVMAEFSEAVVPSDGTWSPNEIASLENLSGNPVNINNAVFVESGMTTELTIQLNTQTDNSQLVVGTDNLDVTVQNVVDLAGNGAASASALGDVVSDADSVTLLDDTDTEDSTYNSLESAINNTKSDFTVQIADNYDSSVDTEDITLTTEDVTIESAVEAFANVDLGASLVISADNTVLKDLIFTGTVQIGTGATTTTTLDTLKLTTSDTAVVVDSSSTGSVAITGSEFTGSGKGYEDNAGVVASISSTTFDGTKNGLKLADGATVDVTATTFMNDIGTPIETSADKLTIVDSVIKNSADIMTVYTGDVTINESDIMSNKEGAELTNKGTNTVDATNNWWGDNSGPSGAGSGSGSAVGDDSIDYEPWLNDEGTKVGTMALSKTFSSSGWHLISFDGEPYNPMPSDLLGVNSDALFWWDETAGEYAQGDEMGATVSSKRGFWFYAGSDIVGVNGTGVVSSGDAYEIRSTVEIDLVNQGWHMISSPFDVSSANVQANQGTSAFESLTQADSNGWMTNGFWAYTLDTNDDGKADDYNKGMSPGSVLVADMGYWVKTEMNNVTLKITYDPDTNPTSNASMAAMGFEPVPEGGLKPPAPPAEMEEESGVLKATAAVSSSGVTFEVSGADVQSMKVQVFSLNGEEIFSESAAGSSLSWNANVANGVYLYGVSAKVGGEVKPLGIQKLLILE